MPVPCTTTRKCAVWMPDPSDDACGTAECPLSTNQLAALDASYAPTTANPYVTENYLPTIIGASIPMRLAVGTLVGATSITVVDAYGDVTANLGWVVIDPYTVECEIRKVTLVAGNVLTIAALTYTHALSDLVLWTPDSAIYAEWFGLVGDNATDNSVAMARLAVAAGNANVGRVIFGAGTYLFGATISWNTLSYNFTIQGQGSTTVLKSTHEDGNDAWYFGDYPAAATSVMTIIRDLHLQGPGRLSGSGDGIRMWNTTQFKFYNVCITDFAGAGLHFDGAQICSVYGGEYRRCGYGVRMGGAGGPGAYGQNLAAAGVFLYDVHIKENTTAGLYFDYGTTGAGNCGIFGGIVQGNYEDGVLLHGSLGFVLDNVWFESNNLSAAANKADIQVTGSAAALLIVNCTGRGANTTGVRLDGTVINHTTLLSCAFTNGMYIGATTSRTLMLNVSITGGFTDNGSVTIRYLYEHLRGTKNWTPGNILNGGFATTTVTVTGAAFTYPVIVGMNGVVAGEILFGTVTGADTVTVTLLNMSGIAQNHAAPLTLTADLFKQRIPI